MSFVQSSIKMALLLLLVMTKLYKFAPILVQSILFILHSPYQYSITNKSLCFFIIQSSPALTSQLLQQQNMYSPHYNQQQYRL